MSGFTGAQPRSWCLWLRLSLSSRHGLWWRRPRGLQSWKHWLLGFCIKPSAQPELGEVEAEVQCTSVVPSSRACDGEPAGSPRVFPWWVLGSVSPTLHSAGGPPCSAEAWESGCQPGTRPRVCVLSLQPETLPGLCSPPHHRAQILPPPLCPESARGPARRRLCSQRPVTRLLGAPAALWPCKLLLGFSYQSQ